jgi:AraC-like DNA-binding protein
LYFSSILEAAMPDANRPVAALRHYGFTDDRPVRFNTKAHSLTDAPIYDMHVAPEIGVVLSGRVERYTSGIRSELPRGGLWIAGPLEPHGRQAMVPDSDIAVFIFSPDFLHRTAVPGVGNALLRLPFTTPAADRQVLVDETFARLCEQLIADLASEDNAAQAAARISLTLLNMILHASRLENFTGTESAAPATAYQRLGPALDLVDADPQRVVTADAARACNLSVSRFTQLFRSATGQSFRQYSLRYRLSRVAEKLRTSEQGLDQLAEDWGFSDKSHLVHRFREHYSVTPDVYRRAH